MSKPLWTPNDELAQQIIELYQGGMSSADILIELKLEIGDPKTIIRWLRRNGIEIRSRGIGEITSECEACGTSFTKRALNYRLCFECAPTSSWYNRYWKHGITKPRFEEMWEKQSGLCDLCELPLPADPFETRIDHCHKQGHVRALLHNKCNIGLHYIEDDKFLAAAIRYIERHKR